MKPLTRLLLAAIAALASLPALSLNHDVVVAPIGRGPFNVACSNLEVDAARLAFLGGNMADYFEGRPVNGVQRYATDILAHLDATVHYNAPVPDVRALYVGNAGGQVPFVAIVCYPTPRANADASYTLPDGAVVPHMEQPGTAPKLIRLPEYLATLGIQASPAPPDVVAPLPTIIYSHGLGGSPVDKGYLETIGELAAQGFIVAAPFHGDPRFSRIRIEDYADLAYLLLNFDRVVEMQALRPVALKAMLDVLLASPYAPAIDADRIGGFGASLGGEAMAHLGGARITATIGGSCGDPVHDPRIRAFVTYVPYAGQSFLPAFCQGQSGADLVDKPFLAISGTADTTAPIKMAEQAVNRMAGSRYLVALTGGKHELRPQDVPDLFTWMITFFDAYLDVRSDPGAMGRLIRMHGVAGGGDDSLQVDVHVPFALANGEALAVEFYNTGLGHYFMATGAGEIDNILKGGAGPGWELTGQAFKAFPQPAPGAAPVCRFYGVPAGGPNSHFFTVDAPECEQVKRNGGWLYEGIGFHVTPPAADGSCPFGMLQVNRAYNNGFPRNDSNHRFSISDSTLGEMARLGWTVEGTVMCARP
ncbi:MAG TPA: hypothetical protein VIR16_02270 [Candidatus Limnocylindrales bacterium]